MGKMGRNDPCPCGSGNKYKKCCLGKTSDTRAESPAADSRQLSLKAEIEAIQQAAVDKLETVRVVGVFILFATASGDGWLLELSDMDAVQVAAGGKKLAIEIDENPETIEINWGHTFSLKDKQFVVTAYKDNKVTSFQDYPTQRIKSTLKKAKKRFPSNLLADLHITGQSEAATRKSS